MPLCKRSIELQMPKTTTMHIPFAWKFLVRFFANGHSLTNKNCILPELLHFCEENSLSLLFNVKFNQMTRNLFPVVSTVLLPTHLLLPLYKFRSVCTQRTREKKITSEKKTMPTLIAFLNFFSVCDAKIPPHLKNQNETISQSLVLFVCSFG